MCVCGGGGGSRQQETGLIGPWAHVSSGGSTREGGDVKKLPSVDNTKLIRIFFYYRQSPFHHQFNFRIILNTHTVLQLLLTRTVFQYLASQTSVFLLQLVKFNVRFCPNFGRDSSNTSSLLVWR